MPPKPTNPLFEPEAKISPQLDELLLNIEVRNMKEVHDLPDADIDLLLNSIKVRTGSKEVLMDFVHEIARREGIRHPDEIYNLKVKVLIDNLAKKMCRCVGELKGKPTYGKEAVCRKTIFQNRGIDFYTFECEPNAENPNRKPRLNSKKGSKMILHRYSAKQQGGDIFGQIKGMIPIPIPGMPGKKQATPNKGSFLTHHSGERPYKVVLDGTNVKIYGQPPSYKQLVLSYNPEKVWVAEGLEGYVAKSKIMKSSFKIRRVPELDGNTVLLKVGGGRYIFISDNIYEFKLPDNDEIVDFFSLMGPNDLPLPVAIGKFNIYFLMENTYVAQAYFDGLTREQLMDAYSYYYGKEGGRELGQFAKELGMKAMD